MLKRIIYSLVFLALVSIIVFGVVSDLESPFDGVQYDDTYTFNLTCNATDVGSDLQNISAYYMFNITDPDEKTLVSYNGDDVTNAWSSRCRYDALCANNSFDADNLSYTQGYYLTVNETYPYFVGFQLNGTYNVSEFVTIYATYDYYCRNYTILTSMDNSTWDVVVNVSNYGTGSRLVDNVKIDRIVPSVEAQYMMINCTAARDNGGSNVDTNIAEIYIYGSDEEKYKWLPQATVDKTGAANSSNFTVTVTNIPNNVTWMCAASNSTHQVNSTSINNLILAMDTVGPVVTQIWPKADSGDGGNSIYHDKDGNISFSYNVTDLTGITNCSLYFNGTLQDSNSSEVTSGTNWINVTGVEDGGHSWLVGCYDSHANENMGNSSARNIGVDSTATLIVMMGDSIIDGRDTLNIDDYLATIHPNAVVVNEGWGGEKVQTAVSSVDRMNYFTLYDADYYIMHWWTNDISQGRTIQQITDDMETMYDFLKTDDNEVVLTAGMYADHSDYGGYPNSSINPTSSNATTQSLMNLANEKDAIFVRWDLAMYKNRTLYNQTDTLGYSDGVHPGSVGNERIARVTYLRLFNYSDFNDVNSTAIYNYTKTGVGEYWLEVSGIPNLGEPAAYINMSVSHASTVHMINNSDGFWKNVTSDANGDLYIDGFNFSTGFYDTEDGVKVNGEMGNFTDFYILSEENDVTGPTVTLVYPIENATLTNVSYTFNVTDASNVTQCELYTNGTLNTSLSIDLNFTDDTGVIGSSVNSNGNSRGFAKTYTDVTFTDDSNLTVYVYYASFTDENYIPISICNANDTDQRECQPGSNITNHTFTLADYTAGSWLTHDFQSHNLSSGNVLIKTGFNDTAKFAIGYVAGANTYQTYYWSGSAWLNWTANGRIYVRLGVYEMDGSYIFGLFETDTSITKNTSQLFYGNTTVGDATQWGVVCTDIGGNSAFASSNITYTTVSDSDDPVVTLTTPAASASTTETNIVFNYTVADSTDEIVSNCSFILDGVSNQTNTSITESVAQSFTQNLSIATYSWYVSCIDQTGNVGNSTARALTVAEVTTTTTTDITIDNGGILYQCMDRIDNDNDGLVDMDDPGCDSRIDNDESDDNVVDENKTVVDIPKGIEKVENIIKEVVKGEEFEVELWDSVDNKTNKVSVVKKILIVSKEDGKEVTVGVEQNSEAPDVVKETLVDGGKVRAGVSSSVEVEQVHFNVSKQLMERINEAQGTKKVYTVYQYIEVETDVEIESAVLQFEVSAKWMDEQGAAKDQVVLLHFVNGEWVELETTYLSGEDVLLFKAKTGSFSVFAVGVQDIGVEYSTEWYGLVVVILAFLGIVGWVLVGKGNK